jgi:hypothetical protein
VCFIRLLSYQPSLADVSIFSPTFCLFLLLCVLGIMMPLNRLKHPPAWVTPAWMPRAA